MAIRAVAAAPLIALLVTAGQQAIPPAVRYEQHVFAGGAAPLVRRGLEALQVGRDLEARDLLARPRARGGPVHDVVVTPGTGAVGCRVFRGV